MSTLLSMPTISVIIPAYNAEYTIQETVKSVLQQSFSDFEIVIVDDGSSDRTLDIVREIADSRLKYFSYANGGSAMARNLGVSHATGEFIAFLDADDLWTSDKLELQFEALQKHPEAGVAYSWTYFSYETEQRSYADTSNCYEGDVYAELLIRNFLHNGSNPLIRKQAIDTIGLFDTSIISCEDWDFYIRLASIYPFVLVRKPQVIYRQTPGTKSSKTNVVENSVLSVIKRAFKSAPPKYKHLESQSLAWGYKHLARQHLKRQGDLNCLKLATGKILKAVYVQPSILLEDYTQGLIRHLIKQWILMCTSITFKTFRR